MLSNEYIAYAMVAVGVFTFYMAMVNLFRSSNRSSRIESSLAASRMTETNEAGDSEASGLVSFCERFVTKPKVESAEYKALMLEMTRAGLDSPYAYTYYMFFKRIMQPIILVSGVLYALYSMENAEGAMNILLRLFVSIFLVIVGFRGAKLYVSNARQKREVVLTDSFPEMMDLLLVCIESGLGLDAALSRVCKELRDMHPEAIAELDRTRLELTMLGDRVIALQNLASRTGILPFLTLVSSLVQTEKFGTSLLDTLRVLSDEQRSTRLYAAEQKAARIPVLITIPLILFIMPAFIMIILGPPVVKVMNNGGLLGGVGLPDK